MKKFRLKKYLLPATVTFVITFGTALYVLYNPPQFLIEYVKNTAETQFQQYTQLVLSTQKFSGLSVSPFNQFISLDGLEILNGNNFKSSQLIKAKNIQVGFNTFRYLFGDPSKSKLVLKIDEPEIYLSRNKNGKLDINSPLFNNPSTSKSSGKTLLPQAEIEITNAKLVYKDQSFNQDLNTEIVIPFLSVNLDKDGFMKLKTEIKEKINSIKLTSDINLNTGKGNIYSSLDIENITSKIPTFYDLSKDKINLKGGNLKLSFNADWNNFNLDNLNYSSTLTFSNLIAKIPYYKRPILLNNLDLIANKEEITINKLDLESENTKINLSGKSNYSSTQDNYFDLEAKVQKLDISKLFASLDSNLIPESIKKLNFSGITSFNTKAQGNFNKIIENKYASYPSGVKIKNILGGLNLENGTFKKIFIDNLSTKFEVNNNDIKITNLFLKALDGNANGDISIKNLFKNDIAKVDIKQARFEGKVNTENVSIDKSLNGLAVKIPNKFFPYGNIDSSSTLKGSLLSPEVDTTFATSKVSFDDKYSKIPDINTFNGKVHYSEKLINFNGNIGAGDFGKTNIDLKLKDLDLIEVKTSFSNLKHNVISSFVPSISTNNGEISGQVMTSFSLAKLNKTNNFSIETIPQVLKIKANTQINRLSVLPSKKVGWINNTDGSFDLNTFNNDIKAKFNIFANNLGNIRGDTTLGTSNSKLNLRLSAFPVKILQIIEPKLKVKSGTLNLISNTNGNINGLIKNFSVANLAKYIDTDTQINLNKGNLLYKLNGEDITLTNWFGDIDVKLNQGKMKSDIFLDSKEYGIAKGFINLDRNSNLNAKITNKKIDLKNVNKFTKAIDVKNGILSFDLLADGNIANIQENPEKLVFKGIFDVEKFNSILPLENKKHLIDINSLKTEISYSAGKLKANLDTNSQSLGKISFDTEVTKNWDIKGNIKVNTEIEKFKEFIPQTTLDIKHSKLDFQTNFNGNLNQYDALKAKGKIALLNNEFDLNEDMRVIKPSFEDDIVSNYNHKIELLGMDFNVNNGIISSDNFILKNKKSKITSNFNFNITNFMSGIPDWGNIKVVSSDLSFDDFSIFKSLGFDKGNLNKLELASNITTDVSSLNTELKTSLSSLSLANGMKFDDLKVNTKVEESNVKIEEVTLSKDNAPIHAKGNVDIKELDNPKFDLEIDSLNFPLKSMIALIPEKYKKSAPKTTDKNDSDESYVKVSYKLPAKNNFVQKVEKISLTDFIDYWVKWSLDPASTDITKVKEEDDSKLLDLLDGKIVSKTTLKGSLSEPELKTETLISNLDFDNKIRFNEVFAQAEYSNEGIKIPRFHFIEDKGGFFELSGNIDNKDNMDFEAYGKMNLNTLDKVLNKNFDSDANALITLDVKGDISNPDVSLSIDSESGGVFNDIPFDKVSILGNYKNEIVFLNEAAIKSGTKNAKVSGLIPLDSNLGSMNVSLGLSGESLSLVNIFTRKVQLLQGDGDVFINLQGDYKDPLINGKINLFDGEVYVDALGKNLKKLKADIDLSNHFVKINDSEALLDGSNIKLLGQIDLIAYRPGFLKLKLSSDSFHWAQGSIDVFGKMAVRVTNTINNPLIAGKVQLTKGEMSFGLGSSKSSSSKSKSTKVTSTVDPMFNKLDLDIPEGTDFWVRSPLFDLRPHGSINLKKGSIYNPVILGSMKIDKGSLYIINNEFVIKEATADFGGKEFDREIFPINPQLKVTAETKLSNSRTKETVQVEANITGDLESIYRNEMKIDWTKTGGLTDSEIWTQVVGINAAQELLQDTNTTGSTLAKFATPYFNRALFNPLTSKIADFLSLEELNVGLASDMLSNPGVSIAVSKPLFYGFSIGYNGTIRSQSSAQYTFFSRYRLNNNFSLRASLDERASAALQGEFGFSF